MDSNVAPNECNELNEHNKRNKRFGTYARNQIFTDVDRNEYHIENKSVGFGIQRLSVILIGIFGVIKLASYFPEAAPFTSSNSQ